MAFNKLICSILSVLALGFSTPVFSAENIIEGEPENTPININEQKDIGMYLLVRVVDTATGKIIEGAEVTSSFGKVFSDDNGEFLLKVKPDDNLTVKKEKYKDVEIKVAALKSKIKMEMVPKYLPIFPNISAAVNYHNLGFSEKLNTISASGRINDGFSIEAAGKLFNFYAGINYENLGGIFRHGTVEDTKFNNNLISLKGAYILNIIPDQLDVSAGARGFWNNITSAPVSGTIDDLERNTDFLDFANSRTGIGGEIEIGARPIKYTPLVINAFFTYYPFISVSQSVEGEIPANLNGFDYGIGARFDMFGGFVQAGFTGKNVFKDKYNSALTGVSAGVGYGF